LLSAGIRLCSLTTPGESNLGLCCTEDGLYFGRTPLMEHRAGCYTLRPRSDLERLFKRSSAGVDLDGLMRGLTVVKSALDEKNLCLAQIAAVRLGIPDLPDFLARTALQREDRLIKAERCGDILARVDWDPDRHPRTGVPPNPGWFTPVDGTSSQGSTHESEEGGAAPNGILQPALRPASNPGDSGSPILPVAERSTGNPDYAARALRMDRTVFGNVLHDIKNRAVSPRTTM
jgi:hypothetical protein